MLQQQYKDNINTVLQKIQEAESIVVGGAAGMSAACGCNWYSSTDESFIKHFGNFIEKYGMDGIFNGFYYRFSTREDRWAYIATLIKFVCDSEVGQTYLDLTKLLENKDYFIVTTNQDTQFSRAFPRDKVSTIQGDWHYFQCNNRCHDQVYFNKEQVDEMYENIDGTRIPTELIPTCPKCGGDMEPWVRSFVFLKGRLYKSELSKYREYLMKNKYKKILFLELGVGTMTPMFIKEPFWRMTTSFPNADYISINPNDAVVPRELEEKGLAITEDIAKIFQDSFKYGAKNEQ